MTELELAWLAGLLEGEGCFDLTSKEKPNRQGIMISYRYPRIQLNMTDRDVIEKVSRLVGKEVFGPYGVKRNKKNPKHKVYYSTRVVGFQAGELMLDIFPFMSARRKAKITEVLMNQGTTVVSS